MYYELYVDSLFFMNFIMNLYLLILVDRSVLGRAGLGRLALGAAVGALGFLVPLFGTGSVILRLAAGLALGMIGMLFISFQIRGLRMFLKLLERLAVYSFGMGGAMLFLIRCLPWARGFLAGAIGVLGTGGLLFILFRRFRYGIHMKADTCRATLIQGDMRMEVAALMDSGNSLTEPVSGKPVCVVDKCVFQTLLKDGARGFRAIPYHSVGKKKGVMWGYLLSGLELESEGMKFFFKDVYVAVSGEALSNGEGADADSIKLIVNPGILTGDGKGKPRKRRNERKDDSENSVTGQDAV